MENAENILKQLREPERIRMLSERLKTLGSTKRMRIMEVCGTHTMAIHRMGLLSLLPPSITLLSGPGCPVCVTPGSYLDTAFAMARSYDITLATFGDMMRVPGAQGTLAGLRSEGYPVEVVYSPLAALELARRSPERRVVFLAVGFETTAPVVAATVMQAHRENIGNFSILCAHKLVIPALEVLISDPATAIDGFILPGHVSIILGAEPYRFIPEQHKRACVITGFEPYDIILGLFMLTGQIESGRFSVEIQYTRSVSPGGNERARSLMFEVFSPADTDWRGFGPIPKSGLALREEYRNFDAASLYPVETEPSPEPAGCSCGEVLRGVFSPRDCPLFATMCTPENPVGPCMVSSEGTCAAFYRYSRTGTTRGA